jgi:hypothetical protein
MVEKYLWVSGGMHHLLTGAASAPNAGGGALIWIRGSRVSVSLRRLTQTARAHVVHERQLVQRRPDAAS